MKNSATHRFAVAACISLVGTAFAGTSSTATAAVSTGFHTPTPGQANVQTTITTFDGVTGLQVEEGLVRPTDPRMAAVGGTALKAKESFNISAGFVAEIGDN